MPARKRQTVRETKKHVSAVATDVSEYDAELRDSYSFSSSSSTSPVLLILTVILMLSVAAATYFLILGAPSSPEDKIQFYNKRSITNMDDFRIRIELDLVDDILEQEDFNEALSQYDTILTTHPFSPRAAYGKALSIDKLAEKHRSNKLVEECIGEYKIIFTDLLDRTPKELLLRAGKRCVNRMAFLRWNKKAVDVLHVLIHNFSDDVTLWNELGVQNLRLDKYIDAKHAFDKVLQIQPNNGFAKAHVGYILQIKYHNPEEAIPYLQEGIASNAPGVQNPRFYYQLGAAYSKTKRQKEAESIFREGVRRGFFSSNSPRPWHHVNNLKRHPWWTKEETTYEKQFKMLEENWKTIRDEGIRLMNITKSRPFQPGAEMENFKETVLYNRGNKITKNCVKVPKTCDLIEKFAACKSCTQGQVKYFMLQPRIKVRPYRGLANSKIRAHLGLVVPDGPMIKVANEIRSWKEGEFLIFDDSFEHEMWHKGERLLLLLIVDVWHPKLTEEQKRTMCPV